MVVRSIHLVRTVRFRLWALTTWVRLRRHGCRFTLDCAETPRFYGLPYVEPDPVGPGPGSLHLKIGRNCKLGRGMILDIHTGKHGVVDIGDRVSFMSRVRLMPWGGTIRLGPDMQVREASELKANGLLDCGEGAMIGRHTTIHAHTHVRLGRFSGYAENTMVVDSDHLHDGSDTFFMHQPVASAPIDVGDNTFIGANCVVLRGARIGRNSFVAAHATVTAGEYPDGWLLVGQPAKPAKELPISRKDYAAAEAAAEHAAR